MIRRPPRSTQSRSSAASDVYKRQQLVSRALSRFSQHSRLLKHLDALTCLRRSDSSRQRLPLGLLEDLGHAEIVRAKLKTRTTFQALPDIFLLQYVLKLTSQNTSYHIVRRVIFINLTDRTVIRTRLALHTGLHHSEIELVRDCRTKHLLPVPSLEKAFDARPVHVQTQFLRVESQGEPEKLGVVENRYVQILFVPSDNGLLGVKLLEACRANDNQCVGADLVKLKQLQPGA